MEPTSRKIQALVDMFLNGKLLLPEMQRKYVWRATQVKERARLCVFQRLGEDDPQGLRSEPYMAAFIAEKPPPRPIFSRA